MIKVEEWLLRIFADPITKKHSDPSKYVNLSGVIDARVFLKNTKGFTKWEEGQIHFEAWASDFDKPMEWYENEVRADEPVYKHFNLSGCVLDCGGGVGTVRHFLPNDVQFVSTDPWINAPFVKKDNQIKVYSCLNNSLNFIAATSEFQPFVSESFDWVHMRSMLDHVQIPDLTLKEAHRILKPGGSLLVGLFVDGGKLGYNSFSNELKIIVKDLFGKLGVKKWKDYHVWHPTYKNLLKLIVDNGFTIDDVYWPEFWKDMVCFVKATKQSELLRNNS